MHISPHQFYSPAICLPTHPITRTPPPPPHTLLLNPGMWVPGKEEDDAEDGTSQEADGEKPVEDLGEKVNKEEQSKESDDEGLYFSEI